MNKQSSIPGLLDHELVVQAESLQKKAQYKEAIKLYKKLLQDTANQVYRDNLAYCYVQRAIGFAAKGMYPEALALRENHIAFAQPPYAAQDQYIVWQIQCSSAEKIAASLKQLSAQQLDKQYPALASVLGFLMLTKHPEFEQLLAQDSALIAHFKIIQTALQAFRDNRIDTFNEALKQLPYRSAFRDFRTLCGAITALSGSSTQAQTLLSKIPANSPYAQFAKLLHACTKEGAELAYELVKLNHQQDRFIAEIKDLSKKQLDFIQHFSRQYEQLSDKVEFNLAIQYKDLIGVDTAQPFCQTLLASYPAGNKDFIKHFGEPSEFEENRVKALLCEQDNNLYDADYYWKQCIAILENNVAKNALQIALILQRMATREPEADKRTELLIQSVQYDPDNRNTYLQIIHHYSQQKTAKDYKFWLNKTLEKFPQDVEVLTQEVKAATQNKTYKKASQYANKILGIDPLNTFAKQTLFSSHLAHARRLMRDKNFSLVAKEMSKAEQLNAGKVYQRQLQLMHALLYFAAEDKQQGLQKITTALADLHADPVNIHFQAGVETMLNGLPVATVLRELPEIKEHLLSKQELTELIQQLKLYAVDSDNWEYVHKALDKIKAPLKKSISEQAYAEELMLSLCQVLDSLDHFELLRHIARVAQAQWNKPIWTYYRVYADNNGEAEDYSYWEVQRLQNAHEQATENKDYPTAMLIDKLLDSYFEAHPERDMGFLEGLFGDSSGAMSDEFEGPLDALFGHLPDRVMIDLNNKSESLVKKMTPEKLSQELAQQVGGDKLLFMAMMVNPDVFSALMILRAADELSIEIDTDIEDVIEVFGIDENASAAPCPF